MGYFVKNVSAFQKSSKIQKHWIRSEIFIKNRKLPKTQAQECTCFKLIFWEKCEKK